MCANCFTTMDATISNVVAATVLLKTPVHRHLAKSGWVAPIDILGQNAHTVAFLRSLDLDPETILGPELVAATQTWTAPTWTRTRSLVPHLNYRPRIKSA